MSSRPGSPSLQWTGVVLAGGRSRRFGRVDKTRLPLGGRTLLQRAVDALRPVTARCVVVGRVPGGTDPDGAEPGWASGGGGVPRLPDRYPDAGPLGGILTALDTIDTSHALLLAVDLPFISRRLLEDVQRAGSDAAVAFLQHADGRLALCVSIRRDCVADVHAAWAQGARRVRDLQDVARPAIVRVDVLASRNALWNVNDPLTYARALEMAEHDCPAC